MKMKISVPATSANIGSGFDCLGMALNLRNYFEFDFGITGEENLAVRAYNEACHHLGVIPEEISVNIESQVPRSRGLGSSATCIVAGVVCANERNGKPLSDDEIFELCTRIEGHPDNVSPAIFGGINCSTIYQGSAKTYKIEHKSNWEFVAMVPDFSMSTKISRVGLPEFISHKRAAENVGSVSFLIGAFLSGDSNLLKIGTRDNLHQPYRLPMISEADKVIELANEAGAIACYLSGSGSTIMAITENSSEFIANIDLSGLKENWDLKALKISDTGYEIL